MGMRNVDAAYLAGFIDGEGCFGFYPRNGKLPRMTFHLGGRDELLMRNIQKMFRDSGFKLNWCCRADKTYMLQTERKSELRRLIECILPYMRPSARKTKAEKILLTLSQPA
jgi:hypothetical protein